MTLLGVLVTWPALALLPALAFALLGRWRHRRVAWVAAAAWLLYAAYETGMKHRILCSGECNIRVDLLLLYPALILLSIVAVVVSFASRPARDTSA